MCNQSSSNEDTAGDGNSPGATTGSKKTESAQHSSNGETPRYVNGHSGEGHQIKIYDSHRPALPRDKPLVIGIRGNWYDVTEYLSHHPGGDVLLDFAGRDATAEFLAYHDAKKVLKYRTPVGTYQFDEDAPGGEKLQGDWLKLYDKYEQFGYNRTPRSFIASRFAIVFGFLAASLSCVWMYLQSSNGLVLFMASLFLAGFWQQSGFLMHDTMHTILFHDRQLDHRLGWIFGNVFMGISAKWWRDEHNEHHLFTNTVIKGVGCTDPQMIDDIFIQDLMIAPFVLDKMPKVMQEMIPRFQHLYFIPILIFVGPYYIKMLAFARERRPWEHFGQSLYWVWVAALLSFFPSWQEALAFYMVGNMFLGVLSIQLLVSHYGRPWSEKQSTKGHWAERQLEAVLDIDCPLWLDWFHGGLHLHSPHHLFPRMSRYYYRAAHKDISEMCTKNGLVLDVECWFPAVIATLEHLRLVGLEVQATQSKMT